MNIRTLRDSEIDSFVKLQQQVYSETENFMISPESKWESCLSSELKNPAVLHLVSERDGELLGFLTFRRGHFERCQHRGEFTMGVIKKSWGLGVGRGLLRSLEAWAHEQGLIRIELSVLENNTRAIQLYVSAGYQVEGRKRAALRVGSTYVDGFWMSKILETIQVA